MKIKHSKSKRKVAQQKNLPCVFFWGAYDVGETASREQSKTILLYSLHIQNKVKESKNKMYNNDNNSSSNYDDENMIQVDNNAKMTRELFMRTDHNGEPYYTASYQFPGTMNFSRGVSFMIFTAEQDSEQLQIAPVDPSRRSRKIVNSTEQLCRVTGPGRVEIKLFENVDKDGNTYHIGEAFAKFNIDTTYPGIFFTLFLSRPGFEKLMMTPLIHKAKTNNRYSSRNENVYSEEQKQYDGVGAAGVQKAMPRSYEVARIASRF